MAATAEYPAMTGGDEVWQRPGRLRWAVAGAVALMLHGLALLATLERTPDGAKAPGAGGYAVSVSTLAAPAGGPRAAGTPVAPPAAEPIEVESAQPAPVLPPVETPPAESSPVQPPPDPVTAEIAPTEALPAESVPADTVSSVTAPVEDAPVVSPPPEALPPEPSPAEVAVDAVPRPVLKPTPPPRVVPAADATPVPREIQVQADPAPEQPVDTASDARPAKMTAETTAETTAAEAPAGDGGEARSEAATDTAGAGGRADVARKTAGDVIDSAGGGAVGTPPDDYMARLRYWLERHKIYPEDARRRRMQGIVRLYFRVTRDGAVAARELREGSGHAPLDAEALEMLHRAEPLPAFTEGMAGGYLDVVVPVRFSLRGNS